MANVPKYIIKRMIPSDALKNVDMAGNGKIDGISLKYVNVLAPLVIEKGFDAEDLKKQLLDAVATIDGRNTELKNGVIFALGKKIMFDNVADLGGMTLPVGGHLFIYIPQPGGIAAGKHVIILKTKFKERIDETQLERDLAGTMKGKELLS